MKTKFAKKKKSKIIYIRRQSSRGKLNCDIRPCLSFFFLNACEKSKHRQISGHNQDRDEVQKMNKAGGRSRARAAIRDLKSGHE